MISLLKYHVVPQVKYARLDTIKTRLCVWNSSIPLLAIFRASLTFSARVHFNKTPQYFTPLSKIQLSFICTILWCSPSTRRSYQTLEYIFQGLRLTFNISLVTGVIRHKIHQGVWFRHYIICWLDYFFCIFISQIKMGGCRKFYSFECINSVARPYHTFDRSFESCAWYICRI